MANIQDRWTQAGPEGKRVRSARYGSGLRWRVEWVETSGAKRSKSFPTKDAAKAHLDAINHEVRSGTYISPDRGLITIEEWSATWLASQTHLRPGGRMTVEGNISKHILPRWGTSSIASIELEDVQAWINSLTVAPATIRRIHGTFLKMLDWAMRTQRIPRNPAKGVTLPPPNKREHRFLTVAEIDKLIETINPAHRAITRCLVFTGLRLGEAAELRVKDVNVLKRTVLVRRAVSTTTGHAIVGPTKTESGDRVVPLPMEVFADVLASVQGRSRDDLVYPTAEGLQFRKDNYRRAFLIAAEKCGLGGMRPHDLRHTAVSLAVASGASVKLIQRMVGHASAAMTLDVYAGLFDQDLAVVTERMDSLIAGERLRS